MTGTKQQFSPHFIFVAQKFASNKFTIIYCHVCHNKFLAALPEDGALTEVLTRIVLRAHNLVCRLPE